MEKIKGITKKVGLPYFNGSTIEIAKTKKGGPNKWYHKYLQKNIVKIIEQLDKLLPSNFVNKRGREANTKILNPVGQRQQKAGNMEERHI